MSPLMFVSGEMHYIPEGPNSFYQLPRAGGVAYAAQESWVQNETIRVSYDVLAPETVPSDRLSCTVLGQHPLRLTVRA